MIFRIKSLESGIPYFEKILRIISDITKKNHCEFMLIGATARDLNLQVVNKYDGSPRATRDLDFGIAISDWSKFNLIVHDLVHIGFQRKNKQEYHRLYFKDIPIQKDNAM